MAIDYFLKIDGIDGESRDDKHLNEITIESFSWGVSNPTMVTRSGSGGGTGKVSFQDFHFTAQTNKASPMLFLSCASGKHIKEAILTARKAGKDQQEFLVIKLTNILVTSYRTDTEVDPSADSSDLVPTDQFSLTFGKVQYEYKPQSSDGSLPSLLASYDLTTDSGA